ncbi:phosphomevalonate kinase [Nocardia transvalensis]|uniref:phosphomevalonate kinase n=1 Tax=Nocardia transvalensis TaxID=37333 RepID=UPI00189318B0|nr:phosphomevalonate kinase [Nocardia transvalensis]MBF6331960.1 phosphomevalonate kinase [Nocardia transvalensis]
MITRRVPGKLFIAGEFAVVEPGGSALLIAVDRYVTVDVAAGRDADVTVTTDIGDHTARFGWSGGRLAPVDESVVDSRWAYVISALEVTGQLLTDLGRPVRSISVAIASTLHDEGIKLGLGSSAAVTVGVVEAVARYHGWHPHADETYRLALIAAARVDPRPSGADLAACVWGGWLHYRSPDRAAVLDMLARHGIWETIHAPWPGLSVTPLRAATRTELLVGWTGTPASTGEQVGKLDLTAPPYRAFRNGSANCVAAMVKAIVEGNDSELLNQVGRARGLLHEFDSVARLGIFTDRLTALCDAAAACGGAAKPAGAGGGDCGIALLDAESRSAAAQLRALWRASGIRPLSLRVSEPR